MQEAVVELEISAQACEPWPGSPVMGQLPAWRSERQICIF